ncbi:cation:proton antiporter domain-containing protein [Streptomyces sp. NPDC055287]
MHTGGGAGQTLWTVALTALFAVVMLTVVSRLLRPLGARVERTGRFGFDEMYLVVALVLLAGLFTDYIGIYSVFGGFVAGLAMPRNSAFLDALQSRMMDTVCVLLLPVFFVFSGRNTQLGGLAGWDMLGPFLLILGAGFIGKYAGCAAAMRTVGFSWRESCARRQPDERPGAHDPDLCQHRPGPRNDHAARLLHAGSRRRGDHSFGHAAVPLGAAEAVREPDDARNADRSPQGISNSGRTSRAVTRCGRP